MSTVSLGLGQNTSFFLRILIVVLHSFLPLLTLCFSLYLLKRVVEEIGKTAKPVLSAS
jgi:hypothetical protein